MNLLSLKVVTPVKVVFEDKDLDSVTLPTEKGEITILPGHLSLVSKLVPGEIIARSKGKEYSLVTTKGFLKYSKEGSILILSDYAVRSEDVEIAKVEEARKKAEEAMREKRSEKDFAIAEAELRRTLMELKVAQKRRGKTSSI